MVPTRSGLYLFSEIVDLAREGGYVSKPSDGYRVSPPDVHHLQAALVRSGRPDVQQATLALTNLRRWLVHGDGKPPPVRGAGFLRSDGELWMAYTDVSFPAIIRGNRAKFEDLRRFIPLTLQEQYDGSLGVQTDPAIRLDYDGSFVVRSSSGEVKLTEDDAARIERWTSVAVQRRDRRIVMCLPGAWQGS